MLAAKDQDDLEQRISAKDIRQQLEQRLQLPASALDGRKKQVTAAAKLFFGAREVHRLKQLLGALVMPEDQVYFDGIGITNGRVRHRVGRQLLSQFVPTVPAVQYLIWANPAGLALARGKF